MTILEGWDGGVGREAQVREDICILWADLRCVYMAETNTTLQNNYSLILKNVMFLGKKVVTSIGEEVEKLTH